MQERICPVCGKPCYSAAAEEKVWECPHCGADVPRCLDDFDFTSDTCDD